MFHVEGRRVGEYETCGENHASHGTINLWFNDSSRYGHYEALIRVRSNEGKVSDDESDEGEKLLSDNDSDDGVKKNSMLKKIEDCMSDGRKFKHKSKVGGSIKMRLRNSTTMKECKVCGVRVWR